ncbi:MAG: DNA-processing protein DprA [Alphaproteobacteria bacterium]|nr:DNA-processing protein DprA [Alphaproteobacteria bacterium]MDE2011599.1 DNA-processing protein DprA [Alphaproteobacteria bacterium]MDE2071945.1 DNA-processing protein DprA [Alphaproteobacteria bacterium]MDE2350748.1 DNA-processing protein DprA [Alphaproteobacteria bacterium]
MSDAERRACLRLARTSNIGPVTFAGLLARFGTAIAALEAVPLLARRGGATQPLKIPTAAVANRELDTLGRLGGRLLTVLDADYPRGLAALDAPPPLLSVLGSPGLLARDMVAVVGARNASALGRKLAQILATDLGKAGLVVASGMARGIDAAAHEGALATGTCAVLAGGVDNIYPPENAGLYERLKAEGAIVSEMPLGQAPQARHFPRRNRIISGLARGVAIVEAAEGSGSLITANYALEQGREIFAVPGSPLDPRAKGTNRLIREGATLTESAADILNALSPIIGRAFREDERQPSFAFAPAGDGGIEREADRVRARLAELIGPAPVEVDELIRQSGASPAAALTVLLELELAGRLVRHPGNKVSMA